MRVSESMSPAFRRALAARVRLPEGGAGVDSIGSRAKNVSGRVACGASRYEEMDTGAGWP